MSKSMFLLQHQILVLYLLDEVANKFVFQNLYNFFMSNVYDWFQERLEIQAIADDITSKYVPPHVNIFLLPWWNYSNMFYCPGCNRFCNDILLPPNSY